MAEPVNGMRRDLNSARYSAAWLHDPTTGTSSASPRASMTTRLPRRPQWAVWTCPARTASVQRPAVVLQWRPTGQPADAVADALRHRLSCSQRSATCNCSCAALLLGHSSQAALSSAIANGVKLLARSSMGSMHPGVSCTILASNSNLNATICIRRTAELVEQARCTRPPANETESLLPSYQGRVHLLISGGTCFRLTS